VEPYEHFTRDIVAGVRGKTTGAFFDFDGTIIATHSVKDMFLERFRAGEVRSPARICTISATWYRATC
jgi:phosphoserine phosphatase